MYIKMNEYFEVSAREQGFADWKDCQNTASKDAFKIVIDRGFELHRLAIESEKRLTLTTGIGKTGKNLATDDFRITEDKRIVFNQLSNGTRVIVYKADDVTDEEIGDALKGRTDTYITSGDINRRNNSEDAIREYLAREIPNRFVKLDDEEMQKESNAGTEDYSKLFETETYANINVEFLKAYQSAKDLGAEHGLNDPRFVAAAAKARQLSARLKQIDDKVHQRTKNSYEPPANATRTGLLLHRDSLLPFIEEMRLKYGNLSKPYLHVLDELHNVENRLAELDNPGAKKFLDNVINRRHVGNYEPTIREQFAAAQPEYDSPEGWEYEKDAEYKRLRSQVSTIPFLMKQGTHKHILIASRLGEIINYKRIGVITQALTIAYALERDDVKPGHIQNATLRRKLEIKLEYLKNLFK